MPCPWLRPYHLHCPPSTDHISSGRNQKPHCLCDGWFPAGGRARRGGRAAPAHKPVILGEAREPVLICLSWDPKSTNAVSCRNPPTPKKTNRINTYSPNSKGRKRVQLQPECNLQYLDSLIIWAPQSQASTSSLVLLVS